MYACLHKYLRSLLFLTVVRQRTLCLYQFSKFFFFSLQCLTTPTVAISAIMVAAYKKCVLVSLLKFGKVKFLLIPIKF